MKYAGIAFESSRNLGDMIQTIAAAQHLPRVNKLLERSRLRLRQVDEPHIAIMQSWFPWNRRDCFPPHHSIRPVFFGFHISRPPPGSKGRNRLLEPDVLKYLRDHQPIGCRDLATVRLLKARGVDAWFSGCLTLTLQKRKKTPEKPRLFIVDAEQIPLPASLMRMEKTHVRHIAPPYCMHNEELKISMAREMLRAYREQATLVVTTRLHCALPCVAMGIPVVFFSDPEDPRLSFAADAGLPIYRIPPRALFSQAARRTRSVNQSLARIAFCRKVRWNPDPIDWAARKTAMVSKIRALVARASEDRIGPDGAL